MTKSASLNKIIVFIIGAYAISWTIEFVAIYRNYFTFKISEIQQYLLFAQFAPTVSAILTIRYFNGSSDLKNALKKFLTFKTSLFSYLISLMLIPITLIITLTIFQVKPVDTNSSLIFYITLLAAPVNGLLSAFVSGVGPLGEEFGWRGFLLPEFLKRFNLTVSSILVGIVWAFWHLPLFFFTEFRNGLTLSQFIILYPTSIILISCFMTIVWRLTNGSIFIAIWVHGIFNVSLAYISDRNIWSMTHLSNLNFYFMVLVSLFLCFIAIRFLSVKIMDNSK